MHTYLVVPLGTIILAIGVCFNRITASYYYFGFCAVAVATYVIHATYILIYTYILQWNPSSDIAAAIGENLVSGVD